MLRTDKGAERIVAKARSMTAGAAKRARATKPPKGQEVDLAKHALDGLNELGLTNILGVALPDTRNLTSEQTRVALDAICAIRQATLAGGVGLLEAMHRAMTKLVEEWYAMAPAASTSPPPGQPSSDPAGASSDGVDSGGGEDGGGGEGGRDGGGGASEKETPDLIETGKNAATGGSTAEHVLQHERLHTRTVKGDNFCSDYSVLTSLGQLEDPDTPTPRDRRLVTALRNRVAEHWTEPRYRAPAGYMTDTHALSTDCYGDPDTIAAAAAELQCDVVSIDETQQQEQNLAFFPHRYTKKGGKMLVGSQLLISATDVLLRLNAPTDTPLVIICWNGVRGTRGHYRAAVHSGSKLNTPPPTNGAVWQPPAWVKTITEPGHSGTVSASAAPTAPQSGARKRGIGVQGDSSSKRGRGAAAAPADVTTSVQHDTRKRSTDAQGGSPSKRRRAEAAATLQRADVDLAADGAAAEKVSCRRPPWPL